MQYLKEEVRITILDNATTEFFNKGFNNASMRAIAKKSKMTVGNIYRYFKNKEDLFRETVRDAYDAIVRLVNVEEGIKIDYIQQFENVEPILEEFIAICTQFPREIVLIIDRYIGVKNYTLLRNIEMLIAARLKIEIPHITEKQAGMVNYIILKGLLYILQSYDIEDLETEIRSFFVFLFKGIELRL